MRYRKEKGAGPGQIAQIPLVRYTSNHMPAHTISLSSPPSLHGDRHSTRRQSTDSLGIRPEALQSSASLHEGTSERRQRRHGLSRIQILNPFARIAHRLTRSKRQREAEEEMYRKQLEKPLAGFTPRDPEDCMCAICLCDYEEGDVLRLLACQHHMHQACVDEWLHINQTCPLCKQMVKTYLRYEAHSTFGVIASPTGNAVFDHSGRLSITPALESVIVWDIKKGTQVARWSDRDNTAEVTCIARSPNGKDYAVGYTDGSIRLFDLTNNAVNVVLNGHRGGISALQFDSSGTVLASGARDTDIVLWDVVGEVGLYRLRGHKDEITGIAFLASAQSADTALNASASGHIVTSSKDTLVKLWDLRAQHCVQTLVTHRSEVWALAVSPDRRLLVTGTSDADLHVWTIDTEKLEATAADSTAEQNWDAIREYGTVRRAGSSRVVTVAFHGTGKYVVCLGADRTAEIFRVRTHAEIKKKLERRQRRNREKNKKGSDDEAVAGAVEITAADELVSFKLIRTSAKAASVDFDPSETDSAALARRGSLRVLIGQNNNTIHVWTVPVPPEGKTTKQANLPEPSLQSCVEMPGHRSEPRALALSSDNELVASAADGSLRIWNARTGACVRTLECGTALCVAFLPGDQTVVVGTKRGTLQVFDIPAATCVETLDAHGGAACWAIDVHPDKKSIITGGADKTVKFWDLQLVRDADAGRRRLTLEHTRTLQMADEVLALRVSADGRLLAVALLDCTVKVFYADTLKFFLSLYGHKLPVVSLDIASDSTLLVTASADKSVKLWGLDFGDCHRSLLAHQEPVTAVRFVWGTHYFFSAGKDRCVIQWDGDKFQRIQKLHGFHGDVWALAVAHYGNFVVASGQDRSIRVWDKTEEPLFLEEERERELDELLDRGLEEAADTPNDVDEAQRAGKATAETLMAGERIAEALDLADGERRKLAEHAEQMRRMPHLNPPLPDPNPILAFEKLSPEAYVLRTVERVRAADLDDALLVLSFSRVLSLLEYIDVWARREWNTPLTCRILFFLLKSHQNQIVATRSMRSRLASIRHALRAGLASQRDQIGYNLAALASLKADWEANATAEFFDDEAIQKILDSQVKKRKFVGLKA
ncbi:beta transducin [Coemansia sp. RSA 989]|nr:beta transducin [Coemansia sp. RSA 1821]KAJ1864196.1 beta transducin [Coemansia sp. RSA 989]